MHIHIDNKCVECGEDTAFGTKKFINRIPVDHPAYEIWAKDKQYMCGHCVSEADEEWSNFHTAISPIRDMKIKMAQKLVRQAVETYAEGARGNGMSVSDYFDLKQALESIDELILRYTEGDDE